MSTAVVAAVFVCLSIMQSSTGSCAKKESKYMFRKLILNAKMLMSSIGDKRLTKLPQ